jgi:hypothetical protein
MEGSNQRPLMYVATHGTDDPTLATMPFLVATGAGSAEIDCSIALLGEAAALRLVRGRPWGDRGRPTDLRAQFTDPVGFSQMAAERSVVSF